MYSHLAHSGGRNAQRKLDRTCVHFIERYLRSTDLRSDIPYPGFPPDEVRIRETRTEYKSAVRFDAKSGREDHLRVVHFFMRTPDDSAITIHTECFPMDFDAITQAQTQSPSPPSQSSSSPEIEHVHSQLVCGL